MKAAAFVVWLAGLVLLSGEIEAFSTVPVCRHDSSSRPRWCPKDGSAVITSATTVPPIWLAPTRSLIPQSRIRRHHRQGLNGRGPSLVLRSAPDGAGAEQAANDSEGDVRKSSDDNNNNNNNNNDRIDLTLDSRLYRVRLPRAMGIDWKTDLSFRWVSVRGMDPTGAACRSGAIEVGDQLCELTPVALAGRAPRPISVLGAPFDEVMQVLAELDRSVAEVDLVFFRGTKEELMAACTGVDKDPDTVTVTVIQNKGSQDESVRTLSAPAGVNLRELLVENGINVYQSVTRWTNCKGKQLCGTCIVNVVDGAIHTNRKSMDEASTLRENPDSYRLSCVAYAYGDVTIETFPPVNAAQWTR